MATRAYGPVSDGELIEWLGGDNDARAEAAFGVLYDRYAGRIYNFIFRRLQDKELSEDMLQEIFLSLWNRRRVAAVTAAEKYLYQAARNQLFSYFRSAGVRKQYAQYFTDFLLEACSDTTNEWIAVNEVQETIEKVLRQLPGRCQTAFRLSRFENKDIAAISEQMNVSRRAVENYLTYALRELRLVLRK